MSDRSAGLGTKEAPAIPTRVVGASSIIALRVRGAETHIHRARAAHSAQFVRRPFAGRPLTDPLERRKALLAKLLRGKQISVVLNETYEDDGEIVFREACKLAFKSGLCGGIRKPPRQSSSFTG
jgi:hypothetical protein